MPYLTLKEVTCRDVNGDSRVHLIGTVLSDWEVEDFVRAKVDEGSIHYRSQLEPLTDSEAHHHRAKATAAEGDHYVDGEHVSPPWDDYVGLHPEEIVARLKESKDKNEVAQVKKYEKGGLNRQSILEYVAPVERPPINDYDELSVRDIIEKLSRMSADAVAEVKTYEASHRNRPAIITYEVEAEPSDSPKRRGRPSADTSEVTA